MKMKMKINPFYGVAFLISTVTCLIGNFALRKYLVFPLKKG